MSQPLTRPESTTRLPLWVSLVMALDAIGFGIAAALIAASGESRDLWQGIMYGALTGGPYLVLPELMRRRPRPLWLGAIAAASIGAALLTFGAFLLLSLGWSDTPGYERGQHQMMLVLLLLALGQLTVVVWVLREISARGGMTEAVAGFGGMMLWPVAAGVIATVGGIQLGALSWARHERESAALARTAIRIERCAIEYARQHEDAGYPSSLAAMGPAGSRCLTKEDLAAKHRGYTVDYLADPADESGRIASFVVRGQGRPEPNVGIFSVWGDSSGTLRRDWGLKAIDETSVAGDGTPVQMQSIHDCVEAMRGESGSLPSGVTQLASAFRAAGNGTRWASRGCSGGGPLTAADSQMAASWAERYGYRVTFARDGESYRVDGRPVTWGETGLRSYMMAETGPIHFTLENRAATADDPELPPCPAYDVGDCTPSALDTPPDARFLHGNAIGFDGAYTLQVRATGSAERYPSGLVWAIECRVEADSAEPTPPLHMSTAMADQQCPNLYWSKTPVGDSIVARLWLRNGAGLTRHIDHVIPVVRKPEDADRGRGGSPPPA